ncbi:MAG: sel1 repeat family protein [Candidatus Adiutrix sp.]|jgi:TPR repeat protein|nr:sel1 repeat family protein [Candidatus Adiutrix sp.]
MRRCCLNLALGLFLAAALPAQADDPARAELLAGLALEYRPVGDPDYQAAAGHYQAAAAAGSREALLALARLSGPGAPLWQGPELWRDRLLAAARAGWPEAAFQLAEGLADQTLTGLDPAAFYFQAATAGHGPAARRLGELYLAGQPKDESQAAFWLALAAENHEPEAALALGKLLYPSRPEAARRWLEQARSAEGSYLLGQIYLKERRYIEALSALTLAADQHYPPAHLALGLLSLNNDFGRRPNPREALQHFKIAAKADLPEGAYQLARMYLTGLATPKDPITGAFWLHQAASRGYEAAGPEYDQVIYNFTVGQKKRLERMIEEGLAPTTKAPGPARAGGDL